MIYTNEELDAMLGVRKYSEVCSKAKCGRTVGPYYSEALAIDAIKEHERWLHTPPRTAT